MSLERAKEYLKQVGYLDRLIEPEVSTATVELAAEALGVKTGQIAKTLSFLVGDQAVLIIAEGDARVDNRKFKDRFHKKARMIPAELVEEKTGHAPGGVCPFGVSGDVEIWLDESLKQHEVIYPAAGNDHSAVRLTPAELETCAGARGWVDVCK